MGQNIFAFNKISPNNITSKIHIPIITAHYIRTTFTSTLQRRIFFGLSNLRAILSKKSWKLQKKLHETLSAPRISQRNYKVQVLKHCTKKNSAILRFVFEYFFFYITIMYFENNFKQKASCASQNTKILSNLNLPATLPQTPQY